MKIRSGRINGRMPSVAVVVLLASLLAGLALSSTFMDQRKKFREEIKYKQETKLDDKGIYSAVIFDKDKGKYNFNVSAADRERIKKYMAAYFSCQDQPLLDKMIDAVNTGSFVIYKEFSKDGVNLKVIFLSPTAKYWDWLIDTNGIEKMFHTYNYSVGLYPKAAEKMYVLLQTEGEFFGVSRSVSLPLLFTKDEARKTYSFHMPAQAEIAQAVKDLPPLKPGRESSEEKFIDYCRAHPYFQEKNQKGEYLVPDKEITKLLEKVVLNMDEGCDVKETTGHWTVQDDFAGYMLVDYSLKTRVNVMAFIPSFMRFAADAVEKAAQSISDEVSVKYLPLSMKNFRDFTQEWTKNGPPE